MNQRFTQRMAGRKRQITHKLNNTNASTKFIYDRMTQLLKFSEMLPQLFLTATTEEKKLIVQLLPNL